MGDDIKAVFGSWRYWAGVLIFAVAWGISMYFLARYFYEDKTQTKEVKTMIYDYGKRQDTVKITTIYGEK